MGRKKKRKKAKAPTGLGDVRRPLCAVASGIAIAFVAPPANLHVLHWVAFLPLFWALREGEHRNNARLGYLCGWAASASIFWWLVETVVRFSNLPWVAGLGVHVVFSTVFAVPYAVVFGLAPWLRQRLGVAWVGVVPALLVAVERVTPALFPYYQGVTQYRVEWTWQLASVLGVMGVSYLVLLVNCAFAEAMYRRREGREQPVRVFALVAFAFVANLVFGALRTARVEGRLAAARKVRVGIVQQAITMEEREAQRDRLGSWARLTERIAGEHPDLVVWPEDAIVENPPEPAVAARLGRIAREGGFDLFLGGGTIEGRTKADRTDHNSTYLFDARGEIAGRYDKMVLLPFGEYVPLSQTFPALKAAVAGPGDIQPGTSPTVFHAAGLTFTAPICYEAILESQIDRLGVADVLVNVTNDGWFGDTAAPHQHAMLAAVQAMQAGRPLVRVAYTGTTMFVEPHGRIAFETKPFTEVAAVAELRVAPVDTIYRAGGWLFPWSCVAASIAAIALAAARERRLAR